jgi:hypothetical protein
MADFARKPLTSLQAFINKAEELMNQEETIYQCIAGIKEEKY